MHFVRTLRNIFLFIGLFVLVGHTIIPHDHYVPQDNCENVHDAESVSLLELLVHIFEEDLGERHLEDLALTDTESFDAAAVSLTEEVLVVFAKARNLFRGSALLSELNRSRKSVPRAPPFA